MAIDNLNFYSNGLPAGQVSDKYTANPGCLRSKNLDIFSSSKSVKATAWTEPTTTDSDVIKQDGKLLLKTDGKVYERTNNGDVLVVDPSTNFPVYGVTYTGGTFENATWGTSQDLVAKYEGDELKSFVVFSDRASYTWSNVKFIPNKTFSYIENLTKEDSVFQGGYLFRQKQAGLTSAEIEISIENADFATIPLRITSHEYSDDCFIELYKARVFIPDYYYDAELDGMTPTAALAESRLLTWEGSLQQNNAIDLTVPTFPTYNGRRILRLEFQWLPNSGSSQYDWDSGELLIDMNGGPEADYRMNSASAGDYNEYWTYLPLRNRKLKEVGDYYWLKGDSFQTLYTWEYEWVKRANGRGKIPRYNLIQYMGWVSDVSMDVIGMIVWNESVYMIGNQNGNGYIIPCDLSGGKGTPYIAYGCEFKGVANIDYLMYLVGEDRGISQLWVYNGQELVIAVGGNKLSTSNDIVDLDEQYKFDGKMVEYRGDLVLTTSDNRIFQYGQTFGGKGGAFIHEIPGTITDLKADGDDLIVEYSVTASGTTTKYLTKYQNATDTKYYNSEWEAVYPIVIGNHLLEKEESDLYLSYILPSKYNKLEVWASANHYHFWTFKVPHNTTTPEVGEKWDIDGNGNPFDMQHLILSWQLEFIERNGDYLTFRLKDELPVMSVSMTGRLVYKSKGTTKYINYTEVNHFRKLGEITASGYTEGEFRFTNLNTKLELPRSYSLQVMVKGVGNSYFTSELFALSLVANQRDRG